MENVTLQGGEKIIAHARKDCETDNTSKYCCIHRPSSHHMRTWPQHWRNDRGIMERICQHGIGHPDPDDLTTDRVHGCDGCCNPKNKYKEID
jgi:hypothetical protein